MENFIPNIYLHQVIHIIYIYIFFFSFKINTIMHSTNTNTSIYSIHVLTKDTISREEWKALFQMAVDENNNTQMR